MKKILTVICAIALASAGVWYVMAPVPDESVAGQRGQPGGRPGGRGFAHQSVPVSVVKVSLSTLSETIEAIGTTRANESVIITAKVTDKITTINFDDGQEVQQGDLLAELTNAEQTAQLAEARADLNDARTQLERLQDLAEKGTASKAQVDEAQARYSITSARLEAIMARLDDRVIRAPFSGVVGFRQISPGTLVSPGTVITTLDDLSTLKLDFAVPELYLSVVELGSRVVAQSPSYGPLSFVGVVTGVNPRIDDITRSITVRAELPNEQRKLRPGMLMTVSLVTSERTALAIPEAAVILGEEDAYVYVVDNESTARQRNVRIGLTSRGRIEIVDGLEAGEQVVVLGLVKLRDGAKVSIQSPTTTADTSSPGGSAAG